MKAAHRARVWRRAGSRCEYCQLHQTDEPFPTFHVEHIVARKHGGNDDPANLALSCHRCNLGKSSNLSGRDILTGDIVLLFHPRMQKWRDHFRWSGPKLVGRTKIGRATIAVLNINQPKQFRLRSILIKASRFPPG